MHCAVCYQGTNMGCSLCQKVFYCSRAHQQKHWTKHKVQCEGRARKVLESEYNTFEDDLQISRKSSPETQKYYMSKQKKQIEEKRDLSRGKQIQFTQRVNRFIENSERRKDQRSKLLLQYTKGLEQQLIARAKNLMAFSEVIKNDFDNIFCKMLIEKYKMRTSKYIQELEYFLDMCFLAKLYLKCSFRQQLIELLYSLELPTLPQKINILNHTDPNELESYKLWKQQVASCKIVLALLASIANAGGFSSYTQTIYKNYIYLIEKCFGVNQQFLAYFLVGNWYAEIRQFNKAKWCFQYCIELKGNQPKQEIIVGDCYYNMALCLRIMNSLTQAIEKMLHSLVIRKDNIGKSSLQAGDCLEFIGKQFIELGRYNEAVDYLNQCYNIRKSLLKSNDAAMITVTELIKKLFLAIRDRQKKESEKMNIHEVDQLRFDMKKVEKQLDLNKSNEHFFEQFGYQTLEKKKLKKLDIDPDWIQQLGSQGLDDLIKIIYKVQSLPSDEAILLILQSQFYKSLSEERKENFKERNPDFRFN